MENKLAIKLGETDMLACVSIPDQFFKTDTLFFTSENSRNTKKQWSKFVKSSFLFW